jgi:hypothetical protein
MTQRSIQAGKTPTVVIRAGSDIRVEGWDADTVQAVSGGKWGLKAEWDGARVSVEAGGEVEVRVPFGSVVDVSAGRDVRVERVQTLARASAGRDLHLDCQTVAGSDVKFEAGRHVRFYVHEGNPARFTIRDLGGEWEATFGDGTTAIRLNAGGDVTLVADREPDHVSEVFGRIERPGPEGEPRPLEGEVAAEH